MKKTPVTLAQQAANLMDSLELCLEGAPDPRRRVYVSALMAVAYRRYLRREEALVDAMHEANDRLRMTVEADMAVYAGMVGH